jgi:hypothetical protein
LPNAAAAPAILIDTGGNLSTDTHHKRGKTLRKRAVRNKTRTKLKRKSRRNM